MWEAKINRVLLFPPVHSYYRFLIHRCVEEFPTLASFSIGEGDHRQAVVCLCKSLQRGPRGQELLMSGLSLQHQTSKGRGRGKTRNSSASSLNGPALLSMEGNEEKNLGVLPSNCTASSHPSTKGSGRGQGRAKKPEMQLYVPKARREQQSDNGLANPQNPERRDHNMDKTASSYSTNCSETGDHSAKKKCKNDEKFELVCLDLQPDFADQKASSELKSSTKSQERILGRFELSPRKSSSVKGSRPDIQLYVPRARRKPDKAENAETFETIIQEPSVKVDHICISNESGFFDNSVSPCKSHRITNENTVVPYLNSAAVDATVSPTQAVSSLQMSLDNLSAAKTKFVNEDNVEDGLGCGDGVICFMKDTEAQPGFSEDSKASSITENDDNVCNFSDKGFFSTTDKHYDSTSSQGNDCLSVSLKHDQGIDLNSEQPVEHADKMFVSTSVSSNTFEGTLKEQHMLYSELAKHSGDENMPKKNGDCLPEEIVFWDRSSESSNYSSSVSDRGNFQQIEQEEDSSLKDRSPESLKLLNPVAGTLALSIIPEERQLYNLSQMEVLESHFSADSESVPPSVDIQCDQMTLESMCFKDCIADGFGDNSTSAEEVMETVGNCDKHKDMSENDIMVDISSNPSVKYQSLQCCDNVSMKTISTEESISVAEVSSSGKKENYLVSKGDNEEDSWDKIFDDNGDCLNPSVMEELTAHVGDVKISMAKAKINYLSYQAREPDMDMEAFSHVIEISDFPVEFQTRDLLGVFKDYMSRGFDIKWVDDTHALGVFSSATAAVEALKMVHPLMKLRPLSEASKQSRAKARRCQEFLQPYKPRPETTAAAARRLVTGALGMSPRISKEQRDQERKQLKEAREKKRQDKKAKDDVWDGIFGSCAMDG